MATAKREESARLEGFFPALRRLGESVYAREIPVIQQATVTDCGAACLAMVLGYHRREVRLDEVRASMEGGRDGVNARLILETAEFHQLRGRAVRIELADLEHLPRASILHWNFSHFVVFDGLDPKGGVRVVDPAYGRRTVPRDEAARSFTGVAVVLERRDDFVTKKAKGNTVLRHLRSALRSSDDWHRIVFVSIFLQLLSLLLPMVHGRLVDRVVPRNDDNLLVVMVCGLVTVLAFHFLASLTRAQLMLQLRTLFDQRMTFGFIEHVLRLPYAFFERRHVGDLQMRVSAVSQIREALTGVLLSGFIDGAMVVGHLLFLSFMSWKVTLYALGIVAVQIVVYLVTRGRLRELAGNNLAKQADAANAMNELLAGMESLKATGNEQRASHGWATRYVDVMNVQLRQGSLLAFATSVLSSLQMLGPMVLLIVGIKQVMDKEMTLGVMLSTNALAVGFLQPVMNLVSSLQNLQLTRAQLDRIDDVRETKPEQEAGAVRMAPVLRGGIALEHVNFRYGPKLKLAVRNVSVTIRPGESVAIVGRSGSGKTTLGRLLLGLYEPDGVVLLDGQPLNRLDLGSVRRQMGVVVQRPHIFGSTVRANIALANPEISLERVRDAAMRACIHDEIMKMPMQYETPVVAGGASLSGGQRQRLALARALVGNPAIVLLDEATSALDAITEAAVQHQLATLRCTRIVIAHRLSTVIGADRILVMEDGALVEQGTHAELLARNGAYTRLVRAQLGQASAAPAKVPEAPAPPWRIPVVTPPAPPPPSPSASPTPPPSPTLVTGRYDRRVVSVPGAPRDPGPQASPDSLCAAAAGAGWGHDLTQTQRMRAVTVPTTGAMGHTQPIPRWDGGRG